MPDVQPFRALRYNLDVVGPLDRVTAPPYDVIDAELRAELAARSPHNIVHVDLPAGEDPYREAARTLAGWIQSGALVRDSAPAVWPLKQEFTGPDGYPHVRSGFFARVRLEEYGPGRIRPHERTHAAAKRDRLELTRATKTNLSPIFGLFTDSAGEAQAALDRATTRGAFAETADADGIVNRIWRTTDPDAIAAWGKVLAENEILIADGHHRYETARTYAEEVGGKGPHEYVLMCLVAMTDPGLVVQPTHRLLAGFDAEAMARLNEGIATTFRAEEVTDDDLRAIGSPGHRAPPGTFGLLTSGGKPQRLTLASPDTAERALSYHAPPYRELDTAILEALVLRGALGMTDADIEAKRSLTYVQGVDDALARVRGGDCEAAFIVSPTPVARVRAVAAAGETMPPKSTYFYPKLLTGLLLNPLTD